MAPADEPSYESALHDALDEPARPRPAPSTGVCEVCDAAGVARRRHRVLDVEVLACAACRLLVPLVFADSIVNGRSRRERIAEFLARTLSG